VGPGLYLHIPYCRSLCPYCDFVKAPLHRAEPARFVAAVLAEADLALAADPGWRRPRTVYLGGGTPTALPPPALAALLDGLARRFDLARVREFTAEANPEGLTRDALALLRCGGVDRLSIGVQSVEPAVLRALGRIHTPERALGAFDLAREAGFSRVSADLMYGVPGETPGGIRAALDALLARGVPHVSIYPLQVEEGTPLASKVARGAVTVPDEEWVHARYEEIVATLRAAGYRHYEVSNFALPGFESRHNEGYWTRRPCLGLGPGAHSFDGRARWSNEGALPGYLGRVESGWLPWKEMEPVTPLLEAEERVFLALRRSRGLRPSFHLKGYAGDAVEGWVRWAERGGAVRVGPAGRIRPTDKGFLLAHDLTAELLTRARLTLPRGGC
jgi:oxygen-independent coproporphyrinogen-3 oxidase